MPVVLLRVPIEVARELRESHGFHTGYTLDEAGLDVGLNEALASLEATGGRERLEQWIRDIQYECGQTEHLICSVWHPSVTRELLETATRCPVFEIAADSLEGALSQFETIVQGRSTLTERSPQTVLLLHASHSVAVDLRRLGFHFGYWRDENTDIDRGLLEIMGDRDIPSEERVTKLEEWLALLRSEAWSVGGVVAVWHPEIDRALLEKAGATILECWADDVKSVLDAWRQRNARLADELAA
jgi:hypothetical protein